MREDRGASRPIVVVGGGLGAALLVRALAEQHVPRSTLVIDRDSAPLSQRSWACFEPHAGTAHRRPAPRAFREVHVAGTQGLQRHRLVEHDYTVVDGAALGHAVDAALAGVSGSRLVAEVTDIVAPTEGRLLVRTHDSEIPADLVFDSVGVGLGRDPRAPTAWMSFTGWRVRVDRPGFVADAVMLMDFRVPQHDQVRFVYVLPDDACLALVELTVISADGSPPDGATGDLTAYLDRELGAGRWHADSGEQGAIPLSPSGRRRDLADGLVTIGSAAGLVKASTGYGYRLMERDAELLARAYPVVNRRRHGLRRRARHRAMDAVFLHLAVTEPMLLVAALEGMFAANPIDRVVRFLNEESSLGDELHVVRSLPRRLFLRAAGQLVVSALPGRRTG